MSRVGDIVYQMNKMHSDLKSLKAESKKLDQKQFTIANRMNMLEKKVPSPAALFFSMPMPSSISGIAPLC